MLTGVTAAVAYLINHLTFKADIKQVRDAAKQVAREPGCRSPDPDDYNKLHDLLEDMKGQDGKVSWDALMEAWREVLCK